MKKFKKLLAGLLAGAMMLGSMTATAFAEGENPSPTPIPTTIDTTKTGSLTIHKYEYNGTAPGTATGKENDSTGIPSDAKPLKDAEFTIYKVKDVNDLKNYYNTNPTTLPSIDDFVTDGKINTQYDVTENKKVGITGNDGLVSFPNLALGFYVVIETKSPDKVTTPVTPFLVSIPMTTADGDSWLYDVHVFPKNKTTYGDVTLEKTGTNGPLSGVTFVLQKKNSTNRWANITNKENGNEEKLTLVTNGEGKINVGGLSQGTYRFIETDRGADNYGYIVDGATTYEFTVNPDGKITYGSKTEANATIQITNEKPDITKEVKDRSTEAWKHATDYNVGDLVPYQITIKVPSNITKLKAFKVTDTPNGLEDDINSIVLTYTNDEGNPEDIGTAAYTKTKNDKGFVIEFIPKEMTTYAGKTIVVTYSAELLSTAATTTDGNSNSAKLEYSNKILPETVDPDNPNKPDPGHPDPGTDTIEDKTVVYTFKFDIVKKADSATGAGLVGVKFDLYKEVAEGTEGAASVDVVKAAGLDSTKFWKKISTLTTGEGGVVSQSGLANGTYYLVETKTAEGYNLLKAPVEVKLNIAYTTTIITEKVFDANGVQTAFVKSKVTTAFTEDGEGSNGTHTETIINKSGFTLPTTGGMGTVIFSVLGIALVLAGLLVITASRKKAAK